MKVIAFGGSNSEHSINKKLATYAANQFSNASVEVLDLNDFAMPLFSVDVEKEIGQHPVAKAFLGKLAEADVLVELKCFGYFSTITSIALSFCEYVASKKTELSINNIKAIFFIVID